MRKPVFAFALTATLLLAAASLFMFSCSEKNLNAEEWVLKINGEALNAKEFESEFARMTYGMDPVDKKASENVEVRNQLLQSLVENRLLAAEARKQGVIVTHDEAALNTRHFFNTMTKADRERYLNALKITEEDIINRDQSSMLVQKYLRTLVFARIVMKAEDLKKYYEEHPECYREAEKVRVRQIVASSEEEAKKAMQRLEAGEDFAKVASEVSVTPEKERGGDLGWIEPGHFPEPFDSVFFELPDNKLSEIIRGDFGYHIIKVIDRHKPVEKPPYEKVELRVRECYFSEARRDAEMNERKRLLEAAKFEYNPKYADLKVQK